MADEVKTVGIPQPGDGDAGPVEPEHRAEDAPFGLKADGTPYKKDPSIYRAREARKRGGRVTKARSKTAKGPDYRESVLGVIQVISLPLAAVATRDDRFAADLVAVEASAEPIADAFDQMARTNDKIAKVLDKLAEVGPYGLLISAVAPLVLQVAANHEAIPPGVAGTVDRQTLLEAAGMAPAEPQGAAA